MANQIAVSFDDEFVRVVYASSSRGSLKVRKTLLMKNEEFDKFLTREKSSDFIVVADFKVFYQDTLYLPPAKKKYFQRIVHSEIKKTIPKLRDFSFFYIVLGETVLGGRKTVEVYFYAVENAELFQLIRHFDKHNKTVKYIFPVVASLSRLVEAASGNKGELQLCVAKTGSNMTVFLAKDGKIYFTRTAQPQETGIHGINVRDINMTVDYCSETLRMPPSSILLLGLEHGESMSFTVPAASVHFPHDIRVSGEDAADFLAPIAALLPGRGAERVSILPRQYELLTLQKRVFAIGTIFLLILSLAGLWYLKIMGSEVSKLKREEELLRTQIGVMESSRRSCELRNNELSKYIPLINFINNINSAPDAQKALLSVSSLKAVHGSALQLNSLTINADTASRGLRLILNGDIVETRYADIREHYSELIKELRVLRGMTVVSDTLDLKNKNFQIEARYIDK